MKKLVRKKFKEGDKIVPLPEADFHYRLSGSILEVEHQLEDALLMLNPCDAQIPGFPIYQAFGYNDTYVHLWKTKDRQVLFGTRRKSFKIDSRYFRLMTEEDMADFMLEDL